MSTFIQSIVFPQSIVKPPRPTLQFGSSWEWNLWGGGGGGKHPLVCGSHSTDVWHVHCIQSIRSSKPNLRSLPAKVLWNNIMLYAEVIYEIRTSIWKYFHPLFHFGSISLPPARIEGMTPWPVASPDFLFWGGTRGAQQFDGGAPLDSDRCRILHHKSQMGGTRGAQDFPGGGTCPPGPPLATPLTLTMSQLISLHLCQCMGPALSKRNTVWIGPCNTDWNALTLFSHCINGHFQQI